MVIKTAQSQSQMNEKKMPDAMSQLSEAPSVSAAQEKHLKPVEFN